MSEHKYTNALAGETSPYLLQHAHNPVQWYPWGEEALARAKAEDKPILLSIGYSACHWCHVMERESFEDEDIAALMNENFINIKVDREERPELDSIYMSAVQLMTGSGGWPLTVFLTPDLVPFYGGTYFPPVDRHGLIGFRRLLVDVSDAYRERRQEICANSLAVTSALARIEELGPEEGGADTRTLDEAVTALTSSYDRDNGGFGQAPKFPPSMSVAFLLRCYARTKDERPRDMAENTLRKMALGGIYDQIGGGFHRYSVDAHWLVPHFEKMLYDNALLSRVYADAWLLTKDSFYRQIAEQTLDYVVREMTSPEGGFYSSQDADSEGEEGKFYVWPAEEVEQRLGPDSEAFCEYFGVSREGNFEARNILQVPRSAETVARLLGVTPKLLMDIVQHGRRILFEAREQRVKPGRDEKILTSWNGLMIRSFAEAANAFNREDYRLVAQRAAEFVLSRLSREGRLLRTYRNGHARLNGYLEDYAFMADALLSLYEATFDQRWMTEAQLLIEALVDHFWDPRGGTFYLTSEDHERLIVRPKDLYDNATPSGNSAAACAMLRLSRFTSEPRWTEIAASIFRRLANPMTRHPLAFGNLLCALDFYVAGGAQIAVVGDPGEPQTRAMLEEVFQRYLPNKVVACGRASGMELLKDRPQVDGLATAYVCWNFVCQPPVTSPGQLASLLR
jgi:uncharacterized protein